MISKDGMASGMPGLFLESLGTGIEAPKEFREDRLSRWEGSTLRGCIRRCTSANA
jgi:hypothetical protein